MYFSYDLPVSQQDLFATFAQMINYPLPKGDKCTYAFDKSADPIESNGYSRNMGQLVRESDMFHHSHNYSPIKAGYLKNDENAKWTIETLKQTCRRVEGWLSNCPYYKPTCSVLRETLFFLNYRNPRE